MQEQKLPELNTKRERMQTHEILKFFASYIKKELGIIYAEHNYFQLTNRLEEICRSSGAKDLNDLYEMFVSHKMPSLNQLILDVSTNNETSFFRDKKVYDAIELLLIDKLQQQNNLNIWSCASSTGQEPLSVSMVIQEVFKKIQRTVPYRILATDISKRALARATSATYTQFEIQRGLPEPMLHQYFNMSSDKWIASPLLQKNIEYRQLNLKSNFALQEQFDLILCRNVLIYQNLESKKNILNRIIQQLAPNGCLIMGSGESLIGINSDLEQVNQQGMVFYKKVIKQNNSESKIA